MIAKRFHWLNVLGIVALAVAITLVATAVGIIDTADRILETTRFAALRHDASGQVVVVEMDAASTAEIKSWPWPREHYAHVLDNLRRAGASNIVFDVDFSSAGTAAGDALLARAFAQARGLVALPTFAQQAGSAEKRSIDTLPLPQFRPNVALASVSIAPDEDGTVRQAPFGTMTSGTPRPSLSSYIAGRSGRADSFFPIDYAIRPSTIPRLSFVAVRDGHFDKRIVEGRSVLIGATAIEMGDRYATPGWGVIPGVIVQALAAETLVAGVPGAGSAAVTSGIAILVALMIASMSRGVSLALATGIASAALWGLILASQALLDLHFPVAAALMIVLSTGMMSAIRLGFQQFHEQRIVDEQTGLPNRRAMQMSDIFDRPRHLAVANLSNLDAVTAVLGHRAVHDLTLRVAERLRLIADHGQVFHLGDKQVALALNPAEDLDEAMQGLRLMLLQPFEAAGRRVDLIITIGVTLTDQSGVAVALNKAVLAAETAQAQGVFWSQSGADIGHLEQSISLMGELDEALGRGDVTVHYQPKLSLADDRIVSVEALVRWKHAVRGNIGPDRFIPLAEQTGRIAPLTLFVLEQTMRDLAAWRAKGMALTAAVNISASLIASPSFGASIFALLENGMVPPDALVFEVTESATLADPEVAIRALERFRSLGVAISMDDYGTGQSTLSYLKTLPLAELKIDRSFVENAHRNRNDALMVRSTIDLAHNLGLKVVAEGIEEPDCLEFLRSVGCDMAQGYLIGRPLPAEDLALMVTGRQSTNQAA